LQGGSGGGILETAFHPFRKGSNLFEQDLVHGHPTVLVVALLFVEAQSSMASNGAQPRAEMSRLFDGRQRLEGQKQDILSYVFGIRTADQAPRKANNRAAIAANQFVEGFQVTQYGGDNQNLVGDGGYVLGHIHSLMRHVW